MDVKILDQYTLADGGKLLAAKKGNAFVVEHDPCDGSDETKLIASYGSGSGAVALEKFNAVKGRLASGGDIADEFPKDEED